MEDLDIPSGSEDGNLSDGEMSDEQNIELDEITDGEESDKGHVGYEDGTLEQPNKCM